MARSRVGTLVVVDGDGKLEGLLTERDLRFVNRRRAARRRPDDARSSSWSCTRVRSRRRTPSGSWSSARSRSCRSSTRDGTLLGLVTARDLTKQRRLPFATRDDQGRLRVGAAIGATGDYLERAAELIKAGVDVLVIDIAHGHSRVMDRAIARSPQAIRRRRADCRQRRRPRRARGSCSSAASTAIKVGIGPGGGCTTRMTTSFGVPQGQALVDCRHRNAAGSDVPLIADGGIKRHGALAMALMFGGDCVMLGSAFAGTEETPGESSTSRCSCRSRRRP